MRKKEYEYEKNVEIVEVKISEEEYNERICRVIEWLIELSLAEEKPKEPSS